MKLCCILPGVVVVAIGDGGVDSLFAGRKIHVDHITQVACWDMGKIGKKASSTIWMMIMEWGYEYEYELQNYCNKVRHYGACKDKFPLI